LLSCIDEHSLHLNWTLVSVGPTRFLRRISSWTALRSTARRGSACREAKTGCGASCKSRLRVRPKMGRSAKTLWATSPTSRRRCLLDGHPCAAFRVGLRAMASLPRTN
jgi:hypothetical protein